MAFQPIIFAKWNGNTVDIIVSQAEEYSADDVVNSKPPVPVRLVDSKDIPNLHPDEDTPGFKLYYEPYVDQILNERGKQITAKIVEAEWRMPQNVSQFYYEYEYIVNGQDYHSYFIKYKDAKKGFDFKKGDTISLIYDPVAPNVHKTEQGFR